MGNLWLESLESSVGPEILRVVNSLPYEKYKEIVLTSFLAVSPIIAEQMGDGKKSRQEHGTALSEELTDARQKIEELQNTVKLMGEEKRDLLYQVQELQDIKELSYDWEELSTEVCRTRNELYGLQAASKVLRQEQRYMDMIEKTISPEFVVPNALCVPLPAYALQGIYFLVDGDELVYVGQSTQAFSRIATHFGDEKKAFTSAYFIPVEHQHLLVGIEAYYIRHLRPRYNRYIPPYQKIIKPQEKFRLPHETGFPNSPTFDVSRSKSVLEKEEGT